jgi:hypothetical protein
MTLWSSLVLAALVWGQPVQPANPIYGPVPRAQCFPVEGLSTGDRAKAEEWLLAALDGEALYTILDTIKPVSSGIHNLSFSSKDPDLTAIEQARRVADALRCGENLTTMVQIFAIESQIERFAELMMINRAEFDAKLAAERGFFARFGLSPGIVPVQAMAVIEHLPRADRYRGYGLLFGFPNFAVDFFVEATQPGADIGPGKDREFYSVPVFKAPKGHFVYAVPIGASERPENKAIADRAAPVLRTYTEYREKYIGEGKRGIVEMLRDLLCDQAALCSPGRMITGARSGI